jgi:hypothetical protein
VRAKHHSLKNNGIGLGYVAEQNAVVVSHLHVLFSLLRYNAVVSIALLLYYYPNDVHHSIPLCPDIMYNMYMFL